MTRNRISAALALLLGLTAIPAHADPVHGNTDDCRIKGAVVHEHNFFGVDKNFVVNFTDKRNGGEIVASVNAGVIGAGQTVVVKVPPEAAHLDHCDVVNHSTALAGGGAGGPGGVAPGARQWLKIEALTIDPLTGETRLGSIFDFVYQAYGSGIVLIPDLWADTNGDGLIADGDLLYSLIDLRAYTHSGADALAAVNARFFAGQAFEILGGTVLGLEGMMFSSTEFTFDPATGYQGTPFTGTGFAVTDHGIGLVSEPGGFAFNAALLALALMWRKRRPNGAAPQALESSR